MATKTKTKRGRPRAEHADRYPVRHGPEQKIQWAAAAATCGLSLQDWIRKTLDGEAWKAVHVPMVKREGVRRVAG